MLVSHPPPSAFSWSQLLPFCVISYPVCVDTAVLYTCWFGTTQCSVRQLNLCPPLRNQGSYPKDVTLCADSVTFNNVTCLYELELKGNFLKRNYNYATNNGLTSLTQLQAVCFVSVETLLVAVSKPIVCIRVWKRRVNFKPTSKMLS